MCFAILLGDELGLYRALAEAGRRAPTTWPARRAATSRLAREWLDGQVAGGLHRPGTTASDRYALGPEARWPLADDDVAGLRRPGA